MPGDNEADVKVRLMVDEGATKSAAEGVRETLKETNEESEKLPRHGKEFGSELLKAELYTRLIFEGAKLVGEGFHQAFEFAEKMADSAMEAANESNVQVRASAGLMSMMDRGAHSMGEVREYAKGIREELAAAGTQAGVSTRAMQEMYDHVIERGGMSTEKAKELTEQMAMVGKVVPQGMEGLAQGFSMMELGIIRARNPLVQLIASTGVLKGNAHAVAAAMQKMTPENQIALAQKAISQQAASMKGGAGVGPATLEEMKASLGNIREGFLEAVGQPLLDRIVPSLSTLRDYLASHSEEIAKYGEEVGQALGNVVQKVEGLVGDVYRGGVRDWEEIKHELGAAEQNWKDTWDIVAGNSKDIHTQLADAAKEIAGAFATASRITEAMAETYRNIVSWGDDYFGQTTDRLKAASAGKEMEGKAGVGGSTADFEAVIDKFRAASMKEIEGQHGKSGAGHDAAVDLLDKQIEAQRSFREAELRDLDAFHAKVDSSNADAIASQIQKARDLHDDAFLGAALNVIGGSDAMTAALMHGGIKIQGGFDSLKEIIERNAPDLAERMRKIQKESFGDKGIEGHGPTMNFFGGVHIKQDFRDQDPDRIIAVFRRDLAQQAVSRRQARTGILGGL
jgi:hypothetical protein